MAIETNGVAIVTGAAGGIGAKVAERLARDGLTVVVNYAGNPVPAEALVRRIEGAGGHAVAARADISDAAAVARMFDSAETAFGGVDVLINNAGIMTLATIAESDDASFDRQVAVNLKGTFNTLREAAKRLRGGGRSDRVEIPQQRPDLRLRQSLLRTIGNLRCLRRKIRQGGRRLESRSSL